MSWKRRLAAGVFAAGMGVLSLGARAEEPAAPKNSDAPVAPKEAPKKKDPFFGDHFAMYLETRGGTSSIKTINNSVNASGQLSSVNSLGFTGSKSGQVTVGWTLPRGRGQYLLTYNGIADGDYTLDAVGLEQAYRKPDQTDSKDVSFLSPWWRVRVRKGELTASLAPPVWTPSSPNDTTVDPSEISYPTTTGTASAHVPKDLGNRIQTWDLAYRREYGGLKIRCRWSAGVRYLEVKGAIATPSWLKGTTAVPPFGYSDGHINRFILMQQSTKGVGPVGSGEIQFNFFRQRLSLYAKAQAAFLDVSLNTDSGPFTYFARAEDSTTTSFPANGDIAAKVSKTAWNTTFEAGIQVQLLEGFHMILDWNRTGYLDALLVPTTISLPQNPQQVALQGASALYVSRDFVVSSLHLGFSFQF